MKTKTRTTQKAVKGNYNIILKVPFCRLQNLLRYEEPEFYNCGAYGWNCDIYTFEHLGYYNIAIATGYRCFGNVHPDYDIIKTFDYEAMKTQERNEITQLLIDFLQRYI